MIAEEVTEPIGRCHVETNQRHRTFPTDLVASQVGRLKPAELAVMDQGRIV